MGKGNLLRPYRASRGGTGDREEAGYLLSLSLVLLVLTGCGGHATIHQIPMGIRKISTTGALVRKTTPDECYYWVNEAGELCVAMREAKWSPLGKRFRSEFIASLVLEGLPARTARNYRVGRRTFRRRL